MDDLRINPGNPDAEYDEAEFQKVLAEVEKEIAVTKDRLNRFDDGDSILPVWWGDPVRPRKQKEQEREFIILAKHADGAKTMVLAMTSRLPKTIGELLKEGFMRFDIQPRG